MAPVIERRARNVQTLAETQRALLVVDGTVVRLPQNNDRGNFGILLWRTFNVFVGEKALEQWRSEFVLNAVVKCSIVWSEAHRKYQVTGIHSIAKPRQ
jgi:hypothetical protein